MNDSVQASNPSWPPKSSLARVAFDISSASVTRAALDVDSVHPRRLGWEGCHASERTSVDSGNSWKVSKCAM